MRVYRQNLYCIIFLRDFDVICCPKKNGFQPFFGENEHLCRGYGKCIFFAKQLNYPPKMCHWVPTNEKTSNYGLGSSPSIPYPPLFEMWQCRKPKILNFFIWYQSIGMLVLKMIILKKQSHPAEGSIFKIQSTKQQYSSPRFDGICSP